MSLYVCVCLFEGGHVYLPSPLFLLLPDRPFVLRDRVHSVYFRAPLRAALGFAAPRSRSLPPPPSPVSPQCLVVSVIQWFV